MIGLKPELQSGHSAYLALPKQSDLQLSSSKGSKKGQSSLAYLAKYLKERDIEILDLSRNDLGNQAMIEVSEIIRDTTSIRELKL